MNINKILLLATALLFGINSGWSVRAKPGIIEYTQKDNTVIKIKLYGDEKFHYATTVDEDLLLVNQEGDYEYAVLNEMGLPALSGVNASRNISFVKGKTLKGADYVPASRLATRSGSPKYRYSDSAFPTKGSPHSLVILVEYQDVKFKTPSPKEYFEEFLNGDNFTKDGASGSCRKFFIDNSMGVFSPTFDVYGPVLLSKNRAFYGGGNEYNANQMVVESVKALDSEVDFSQYDHNNDGYVDSVYIIYADKGEANGGPSESVWPYSFELESEGISLRADGVKFNTYGVSNELDGRGKPEGIGTFTHEFGHVLGLPDLYNTENSYDTSTPMEWSVMDSGNYNNDGRTPCYYTAFERYSLGWIEPMEIGKSKEYWLPNLGDTNRAYIMTSEENKDEFYMLEYRLPQGWDRFNPGKGMLIWHIDFNQTEWDLNEVNNDRSHHYVDLIRADNKKTSSTLSGDPFPGSDNVTAFSNSGRPALKTWRGNDLNVTSLSNIREENDIVYFYAEVTEERNTVDAGIETGIFPDNFDVEGNKVIATSGSVSVYDISGRLAGIASPHNSLVLERGIYIIGGKKIVIR